MTTDLVVSGDRWPWKLLFGVNYARRTQADKMKISVELVKISVEKSVETNSNDKFHSVRLPTIFILTISENLKYFSADFHFYR